MAKEVCEILGFLQAHHAVVSFDEGERYTVTVIDAIGRKQGTNNKNEPGIYTMILRSCKLESRASKRWGIHEIIPST